MNSTESTQQYGKPPSRSILKIFTLINVWVYRLSNGRWMNKLGGYYICIVTMTGAKSGKRRTIPLMYVPYKDGVILVASQGGSPKNPTWYHNVIAHPHIQVEQGGRKMALVARMVSSAEKTELWPTCVKYYAPYETYQKRTQRDIPVFLCEPE